MPQAWGSILEPAHRARPRRATARPRPCTPAGEIVGIVGPSGSGKTSLLRAIAGLLRPRRGRVAFDHDVWLDTAHGIDRPTRQRPIGYVSQHYGLFPHLTALENVACSLLDSRPPSATRRRGAARAGARRRSRGAPAARALGWPAAARRDGAGAGAQSPRAAAGRAVLLRGPQHAQAPVCRAEAPARRALADRCCSSLTTSTRRPCSPRICA